MAWYRQRVSAFLYHLLSKVHSLECSSMVSFQREKINLVIASMLVVLFGLSELFFLFVPLSAVGLSLHILVSHEVSYTL